MHRAFNPILTRRRRVRPSARRQLPLSKTRLLACPPPGRPCLRRSRAVAADSCKFTARNESSLSHSQCQLVQFKRGVPKEPLAERISNCNL